MESRIHLAEQVDYQPLIKTKFSSCIDTWNMIGRVPKVWKTYSGDIFNRELLDEIYRRCQELLDQIYLRCKFSGRLEPGESPMDYVLNHLHERS